MSDNTNLFIGIGIVAFYLLFINNSNSQPAQPAQQGNPIFTILIVVGIGYVIYNAIINNNKDVKNDNILKSSPL